MSIERYIIGYDATIMEAIKKIDKNQKGFLIATDNNLKVFGVLTDGDIRRGFIQGYSTQDSIKKVYIKSPRVIYSDDTIAMAIDSFKEYPIDFLPIIDRSQKLVNVITKRQLHSLLLQDIQADLLYDFTKIDESLVDYEIFQRPWGFYKTTVYNQYFQSKIICIKPQGRMSLQYHQHREEYWIVVHGLGEVRLGDSVLSVSCGSTLFVPKGVMHRITNTSDTESLIITEVQVGEYLGEDDIIRIEDDYGR